MGLTERSFLERMELMGLYPSTTNADRIRAMTDEELSNFIWKLQNTKKFRSTNGWLDWLRQKAQDA